MKGRRDKRNNLPKRTFTRQATQLNFPSLTTDDTVTQMAINVLSFHP